MGKFWKDKSGEPITSIWYYSIEFFDITYSFIDIKYMREFRDTVAARKFSSPRSWVGFGGGKFSVPLNALWKKNVFSFLKFRLRESYILFRHQEEIVRLIDEAYQHFLAEQETEEVSEQVQNSRDWR
jgi:hypothetical protein